MAVNQTAVLKPSATLPTLAHLAFAIALLSLFSQSLKGKLYTIMEICRLFDQNFREHLDETTINGEFRKLITEADGYQPHLIAPEQGYQRLIESILVTIRGPAEAAVDATHSILKDLVHKAMSETPTSGDFQGKNRPPV
ncbi:hypothetical protein ES332_A07G124200v1 [Gossypium tomentosum]|uniref:Dynamin stalk domain-containing protein n=1 Tax=Gossypium tomentosum TaxID=34277 RepID=A0A5D2PS76_GOSTO|nr:hypothetical protein ES332_A07G124200v1 [Gossypium tomentosum]